MKLGHAYNFASGPALESCNCLGYRFDEDIGFQPDAGESWILSVTSGIMLNGLWGMRGWFTGLWRSMAGVVYVTDANGSVCVNPNPVPHAAPWDVRRLGGTLEGVWGLGDDNVFVWGRKGGAPLLYRWDGTRWSEIASPGLIVGMHGIAPDCIFAVGEKGLVARWNGSSWNTYAPETHRVLSSVFVAEEDEIYACGVSNVILQGSVHGWGKLMEHNSLTGCIVKFRGEWWVGAGSELGLSVLDGDKLVSKKPNIVPFSMDARGDLVMAASVAIAATTDGVGFMGCSLTAFEEAADESEPMWLE